MTKRTNYDREREEMISFSRWWILVVALTLLTVTIAGIYHFASKPARLLDKVTEPNHIINSYESFQNKYNACLSICNKIKVAESSEEDAFEGGTSKATVIRNYNELLVTRIQEYNADSKKITKNQWKSGDLPYQLDIETICKQK